MKITKKLLSIPPHISTAWDNVAALRLEEPGEDGRQPLLIMLADGTQVRVPGLNAVEVAQIFRLHAESLEEFEAGLSTTPSPSLERLMQQAQSLGNQVVGLPIRFGPEGLEGFGNAMQHDPAQANMPPLPDEILSKIAGISRVLGVDDAEELPRPEANCNCFHCQVARAIRQGTDTEEEVLEEEVSDEELKFREWDIENMGEKLYSVANPLDLSEQYSVFLGEPLGCTCGEKNCEHIKAVLQS